MSDATNFTPLEDALFTWVVNATEIPAKRVVWEHQRAPRPDSSTTPFIEMMITELRKFGYDWEDVSDNPSPSPGAEIIRTARGSRVCVLSIQCFSKYMIGGTVQNAMSALNDIVSFFPFAADALRANDIGVMEFGPWRGGPLPIPIGLDPRAKLDVTFSTSSELSMPDTYIQYVSVTKLDTQWVASTHYGVAQRVTNDGKVYKAIVAGTSASSGGPTTRDPNITDGTAHWKYVGDGPGSQLWIPSDPTP